MSKLTALTLLIGVYFLTSVSLIFAAEKNKSVKSFKSLSDAEIKTILTKLQNPDKARIYVFRPSSFGTWYQVNGYHVYDGNQHIARFKSSHEKNTFPDFVIVARGYVLIGNIPNYTGVFNRHIIWERPPGLLSIRLKIRSGVFAASQDSLIVVNKGKSYYFRIKNKFAASSRFNPLEQISEKEAIKYLRNSTRLEQ